MIGHNAEAAVAVASPSEDQPTLFHYVMWHIGDYKEGTANMTFEIEGAYIRFLMQLYGSGKPLPDDDLIMARRMGTVTRVWRRIKQVLIGVGKIIARNGCLTNARFERERQARAEEIKKRSAAATARWRKGRGSANEEPIATPTQSTCNANTTPIQRRTDGKKLNKINEPSIQMDMLSNNQNPITINQETLPTTESVLPAARVSLDEVEGLNGATLTIQTTLAKWIRPNQPDYRTAREWLTSTVQLFGSDAVKEAFAVMKTKMASGDIVGAPLKLMTKICQEKKRELDERAQKKADVVSLKGLHEGARKRIEDDRKRLREQGGSGILWE